MNKKVFIPVFAAILLVGSTAFAAKASAESFWEHLGIGVHQSDEQQQRDHNDQGEKDQNDHGDRHDQGENDQNDQSDQNDQGDENDNTQADIGEHMNAHHDEEDHHGVFGTVTAINGAIITIQNKSEEEDQPAVVTYAVNASKASIEKAGDAIAVSNIAIGDTLIVEGTVDGSTVTATSIRDGFGPKKDSHHAPLHALASGQPVIGGKVTAISGTTVTIANNSNVSYVIDAANAKISKDGDNATISSITVGDQVLAQGTINGSAVNATGLVDTTVTSAPENNDNEGVHIGFLNQIGGFFKHLFGF